MTYQQECRKTWNIDRQPLDAKQAERLNIALGIAGEAGELANAIKKQTFYGKPPDRSALVDELGDVLYYCAMMADSLGVQLDDVMALNIAKLRNRHGETFDASHYNGNQAGGGALVDVPRDKDGHVYRDFG